MRHGLMIWREEELSRADVLARQQRMQAAMRARGLDAALFYTNHVRCAAVSYLTGFTPYWADGLLLLPAAGRPVLAVTLGKRVGEWLRATNPTAEVVSSPQPGRVLAERLAQLHPAKVGVHELERLPGALIEELLSVEAFALEDATAAFAEIRAKGDAAERGLARKGDAIAAAAFAAVPPKPARAGEVTGALELSIRSAGAEECYLAVAPDLALDTRLARIDGRTPLGPSFAVRVSLAYCGVWVRRTESFSRSQARAAGAGLAARADALAASLDLRQPLAAQIESFAWPEPAALQDWSIEAPFGTLPLQRVLAKAMPRDAALPYGVLNLRLQGRGSPWLLARAVGVAGSPQRLA